MITTLEKAPSYSGGDFLPPSAGVHDLGSTSLEWDNIFFGDDGGVYLGLDQDGGLYHKAASIAADEEITGVIEGTSDVLATAANSIYLFNVTNDGDIHLVVSKAGNSHTAFLADGSTGDTIINAASGQSVDVYIAGVKQIDYAAGAMAFQQNTTISTTLGDLLLRPVAGADVLIGEGTSTILYIDGGHKTVGISAAAGATQALTIDHNFGETDASVRGLNCIARAHETDGDTSALLQGARGVVELNNSNTRGWTATVGLRAVTGLVNCAGGSGTILGAAGVFVQSTTVSGVTLTNNYGVYIEEQDAGTNNYGIVWASHLKYSDATFAFQEPTTISTSSGNLSLDAASGSAIRLNDAQANVDVVVEADAFDNLFKTDAALGVVTFGNVTVADRFLHIDDPARTITSDGDYHQLYVDGNGANTVSDGTTSENVGSMIIWRPLITLAGSGAVTNAYTLKIQDAPSLGSNNYAFWVGAGAVRLDGSLWVESTPTQGSSGEQLTSGGAGAVMNWTAASSLREFKDVGVPLDPTLALNKILGATPSRFRYKDWRREGLERMINTGDYATEYVGIMADEFPEVMHHEGRIFSPPSAFGYTVAAFQAMDNKIRELEGQIAILGG